MDEKKKLKEPIASSHPAEKISVAQNNDLITFQQELEENHPSLVATYQRLLDKAESKQLSSPTDLV